MLSSIIVDNYPFPIACLYKNLDREDHFSKKTTIALELCDILINYSGTLLLALYYQNKITQKVSENRLYALNTPSIQNWLKFMEAVLTPPQKYPLLQKFQQWYQEIKERKDVLAQTIINGQKRIEQLSCIDNICNIRRLFSKMTIMTEDQCQLYWEYCRPVLTTMLQKWEFIQDYPLWHIDSNGQNAFRLTGSTFSFAKKKIAESSNLQPNQIYMMNEEFPAFPLYPFFVYEPCPFCIEEERFNPWEIFLFAGKTPKHICYSGDIHKIALKAPHKSYVSLLAPSPSIKLQGPEILEFVKKNTNQRWEELQQAKITQTYYPRKKEEALLQSFLKQQKPLFILTGEKGVGKTALLANMAKEWQQDKTPVFFIPAFSQAKLDLEQTLVDILGSQKNWLKARNETLENRRHWILLIDAVDKISDPASFFEMLEHFLQKHEDYIKIIISLQSFYYFLWQKYIPKKSAMGIDGICPVIEADLSYWSMPCFSESESREAYYCYAKKQKGGFPSFKELPSKLKGILRNPALMKMFFSCSNNAPLANILNFHTFCENYVTNRILSSKERRDFLNILIGEMVKNSRTHFTIEQLIELNEIQITSELLQTNGQSLVDELVEEGILLRYRFSSSRGSNTIICLSNSLLESYLLYRFGFIAQNFIEPDLSLIVDKVIQGYYHLWGMVYFSLFHFLEKQQFDRFIEIITKISEHCPVSLFTIISHIVYEILAVKYRISSQKIGNGGYFDEFLKNSAQLFLVEISEALERFAAYLCSEQQIRGASYLFECLSINKKLSNDCALVAGWCHLQLGNIDQACALFQTASKISGKLAPGKEISAYNLMAKVHIELSLLNSAEQWMQKVEPMIAADSNSESEMAYWENKGKFAQRLRDYHKTYQCFDRQKNIAEYGNRPYCLADAFGNLAALSQKMGNNEESLAYRQKAAEIYREMHDDQNYAKCLSQIAVYYIEQKQFDAAIPHAAKALEKYQQTTDKQKLADYYLFFASICKHTKRNERCGEYYRQAFELYASLASETGMAKSQKKLGQFAYLQGKFSEAKEHLCQALEYYQKIEDKTNIGKIFYFLCDIEEKNEDWIKARDYGVEYLQHCLQTANAGQQKKAHSKMALIFCHCAEYQKMEQQLKQIRELDRLESSTIESAKTIAIEAMTKYLQGEPETAISMYRTALNYLEDSSEKTKIEGHLCRELGILYKYQENYRAAQTFLKKSIDLENSAEAAQSCRLLGQICEADNDHPQALAYYKQELDFLVYSIDRKVLAEAYNNLAIYQYNRFEYPEALTFLEKSLTLYQEIDEQEMIKMTRERIEHTKKIIQ